jgi:hypothetical protein
MRGRRGLPALLLAGLVAPAAADPAQLAALMAGEWNNHEQVWQQKIDIADPKVTAKPALSEHLHQTVWPIKGSALGAQVLFVQPAAGGDTAALRAPYLLRVVPDTEGAVRIETLRISDAAKWQNAHRRSEGATAAAALTAADLKADPACEWRLLPAADKSGWTGAPRSGPCGDARSMSLGTERWSQGAINARKVRYYTGWLWFRNAGPGSSADDKDTSFTARFLVHNEGQKVPVLRKDGSETPWAVELAVLTYQNTRRPILKLALVDRATGKSVSYTWTDTDGRTIGINLGWFQTGLTMKAENVAFGF